MCCHISRDRGLSIVPEPRALPSAPPRVPSPAPDPACGAAAELSLELQQLRHCLALVARCAAVELATLMPSLFTRALKRLLWEALAPWSQEASPDAKPGTYRAQVSPKP